METVDRAASLLVESLPAARLKKTESETGKKAAEGVTDAGHAASPLEVRSISRRHASAASREISTFRPTRIRAGPRPSSHRS